MSTRDDPHKQRADHRTETDLTSNELTGNELDAEMAVDLPEREAMSTFGHGFGHGFDHGIDIDGDNVAMPINEASAANISSTSSVAAADADQTVIIYQTSEKR
jgi:hypothetical protein